MRYLKIRMKTFMINSEETGLVIFLCFYGQEIFYQKKDDYENNLYELSH